MTIYAVLKAYLTDGSISYQILPYDLKGTIVCHFRFYKGFRSLVPFLMRCRLTEKSTNRLKAKMEDK